MQSGPHGLECHVFIVSHRHSDPAIKMNSARANRAFCTGGCATMPRMFLHRVLARHRRCRTA
jgi:hypothetical protein